MIVLISFLMKMVWTIIKTMIISMDISTEKEFLIEEEVCDEIGIGGW